MCILVDFPLKKAFYGLKSLTTLNPDSDRLFYFSKKHLIQRKFAFLDINRGLF